MLLSFPGAGRNQGAGAYGAGTAGIAPAAALQQLRAYWEALRQGPLLPLRSAIDPRGIEGALGGAFILERIAPGVARFRIAGMQLADLAGCDPRGLPASLLFDPRGRQILADKLEQVFTGPAMLELTMEAERGVGRPALTGRMMILPLRNEAGVTDLAIGGLVLAGEVGRRSRRFHIGSATVTPVGGHAGRPVTQAVPESGCAEPVVRFMRPPAKADKPNLRLVSSKE